MERLFKNRYFHFIILFFIFIFLLYLCLLFPVLRSLLYLVLIQPFLIYFFLINVYLRQHIVGTYFFFNPFCQSLVIGVFRSFISQCDNFALLGLKVVILLFVLCLFFLVLFSVYSSCLLLGYSTILLEFHLIYLYCFSVYVFVQIFKWFLYILCCTY